MRFISLFVSLATIAMLVFYPYAVNEIGGVSHMFIMLLVISCCFSFIYGIGYKAELLILKIVTHPVVTLPSIALCYYKIIL